MILIMIIYNDCNRKGTTLLFLAGFLKRDCLVTFSKISLVFLLQLLGKSFSIIIIIIVIIINIPIINYSFEFIFSFIIIGYFSIYYFITIFLYIFSFIHFSFFKFIFAPISYIYSSFDLLLFFNFVIPISPAAFYYFKSYPYWP